MKTWYQASAILLLMTSAPLGLQAQQASTRSAKPVLFVCEHGTVKSLLAKVLFEEYAAQVGLNMKAVSRGTLADSLVPPWMLQGLAADQVKLGQWRPQTLQPGDFTNASYVVSFDVPNAAMAGVRTPRAQWDSLPSVSRDYAKGRDAIKVRVRQLVDSLKRANGGG